MYIPPLEIQNNAFLKHVQLFYQLDHIWRTLITKQNITAYYQSVTQTVNNKCFCKVSVNEGSKLTYYSPCLLIHNHIRITGCGWFSNRENSFKLISLPFITNTFICSSCVARETNPAQYCIQKKKNFQLSHIPAQVSTNRKKRQIITKTKKLDFSFCWEKKRKVSWKMFRSCKHELLFQRQSAEQSENGCGRTSFTKVFTFDLMIRSRSLGKFTYFAFCYGWGDRM